MITGVHSIIYNKNADKLRAFFRGVLAFPFVDAGHNWLIVALPTGEHGIHPTRAESSHKMYLMCGDLEATLAGLQAKGVEQAEPISDQPWGRLATIKIRVAMCCASTSHGIPPRSGTWARLPQVAQTQQHRPEPEGRTPVILLL